jgi:uncharacterized membrane protein YphA (DoxX/SURF4 family)
MAKTTRNTHALIFLRICVGLLFVIFGQYKVFGTQFTLHGGFEYWINKFIADGAYPFAVPLLKNIVLPHAHVFAFVVAYGELAIGLSLIFGVLTRIASIFGFVYMMSLLFSANYPGSHAAFWMYFGAALEHLVLALCFVAFIIGDPEDRLALSIQRVKPRKL